MAVLSCIAMNRPGVMTGTAPEASFWLLRSEDEYSEHLVEQDYWAAAVEYADSVGVDVLNTSLGYYAFDDKSKNYKLRNLDGTDALMSRQASRIAIRAWYWYAVPEIRAPVLGRRLRLRAMPGMC